MLGLAILFGLAVWCGITLAATIVGHKLGKNFHYPKTGAFIGFMLFMGGWFVYWVIEFAYFQVKVSYLCKKEAGITVYVTPEQWRKQIGEDEWNTLKTHDYLEAQEYPRDKKMINGVEYRPISSINKRLVRYSDYYKINTFTGKRHVIIEDIKTHTRIMEYTYFSAGAGTWLTGGSFKSWLNNIDDCSDNIREEYRLKIQSYSNPNLSTGD